jgi:hypothetical protein
MSSEERIIFRDEQRKTAVNNRLKSKLSDYIKKESILEHSWGSVITGMPPNKFKQNEDEIQVVIDRSESFPSMFSVLFCSLDFSMLMLYTLVFIEIEIIYGNRGNSMLSIFIVYVVERILRKLRQSLGQ